MFVKEAPKVLFIIVKGSKAFMVAMEESGRSFKKYHSNLDRFSVKIGSEYNR